VPLVARDRSARAGAPDITLEQLVDAGEAMLMEMVKLARQREREVECAES
jgi:pyroglutamyl-peptidase